MLLTVLLDTVLPIFVIIGMGYLLGRLRSVDVRSVSRVVLYVLTPCLVFTSLVQSTLTATDLSNIVSFVLLNTLILGLIAWGVTRWLRFDLARQNAFLLSTLFMNSGNYGLSANLFAFGDPGLERAIVFFMTSTLLTNTLAVYLASRGQGRARDALSNIVKLPAIYAMVLAFLVRAMGLVVPASLFKPMQMAGQAAIPVLLLTLGMELTRVVLDQEMFAVAMAVVVRLVIAAAVALGLAGIMGIPGLTRQVCITEASMPTAVYTIVLAIEFGADPRFVTSVVFASTLASIATLTVLLSFVIL